jgi:hypothetical protein
MTPKSLGRKYLRCKELGRLGLMRKKTLQIVVKKLVAPTNCGNTHPVAQLDRAFKGG